MNTNPEQDPWDHLVDRDRETPDKSDDEYRCYRPAAATIACTIIACLVLLGFACYGGYRLLCMFLNLAP